jgi:ubiquinone/menaquinone biosynthesis C-methylase UbiE
MSLFDKLLGRKRKLKLTPDLAREIRRSFEEASTDEEHFPSTIDPRILHVRLVVEYLGDLGTGAALDVGCGKGRFARIVKQHNPGARIVASDLAVSMLVHAPADLCRVSASMLDLPFKSGSFDAAYATESLEHAVDVERAVAEMCRVVRPGGRIVIIDKNAEHWGRFQTPKWERWFKPDELLAMLGRHCSKVECKPISYWEDIEPDGLFLAWTAIH